MAVKFVKALVLQTVSAFVVMSFSVLAMAQPATATPRLTLKMTAEKEVTAVKDGRKVVEMRPAETAKAGEVILYTVTYTNVGDSEARNAVISDPVPKDMVYILGSAKGKGAEVTFSIDGGKTFNKTPKQVVTGPGGRKEERNAAPEMYTDIRWTVKKIDSKESGTVSFKATVK